MKSQVIIRSLLSLLALPVLGSFTGTASGTSIEAQSTFDYPGDVISTQPQKISGNSVVVGTFTNSAGAQLGFVRTRHGRFSDPIMDPNDTGGITQCRGVNNSRLVCGDYIDGDSQNYHGFFLDGSTITNYDVPGSTWTLILGLNNAGDFCGSDIPASGTQSGFVSIGGTVTEFTIPVATNTLAYQINSTNQACGYYTDSDTITHGYYREADGTLVYPIDPVGSVGTIVFGNNNANMIVGRYADSAGLTHGFMFIPPDQYITYDYPGSSFTSLNGITSKGLIVGRYLGTDGIEHGLIARTVADGNRSSGGTIPQRHSALESSNVAVKAPVVLPAY